MYGLWAGPVVVLRLSFRWWGTFVGCSVNGVESDAVTHLSCSLSCHIKTRLAGQLFALFTFSVERNYTPLFHPGHISIPTQVTPSYSFLCFISFLPHSPRLSSHSASEIFFGRDGGRIGGAYLKVIYEEYTDDTFTTTKPSTPDSKHLGLLGKGRFLISQKSHTCLFVLVHWCLVFHQSSLNTLYCSSAFVQVRSWGQRKEIRSESPSWIELIGTTASSLMACTTTNTSREAAMKTVRKWYLLIVRFQDSSWMTIKEEDLINKSYRWCDHVHHK